MDNNLIYLNPVNTSKTYLRDDHIHTMLQFLLMGSKFTFHYAKTERFS